MLPNGAICLAPPLVIFQIIPQIQLLHLRFLPKCCLFWRRLQTLRLLFLSLLPILLPAPLLVLLFPVSQVFLSPVSLVLLLILPSRRFRILLTMIRKPCRHHLCVLQCALSPSCHLRLQVHLLDLRLLPRLRPLLFLLPFIASFRISTTLVNPTPIFQAGTL